jgi:hypothetical protein
MKNTKGFGWPCPAVHCLSCWLACLGWCPLMSWRCSYIRKGLILKHEGIIKRCVNSNLTIILDRRSSPTKRSTFGINSTTNEKFPLWNSMIVLSVAQVGTPQSSLIFDLLQDHSQPLDQVEWKDIVSHKEGPSDMENT